MAEPQPTPIPKCVGCGFLTMRNLRTRELGEVDEEYRRTGNVPRHKQIVVGGAGNRAADLDVDTFRFVPICFVGAAPLADEIDPTALARNEYKDFTAGLIGDTLRRDRPECAASKAFTPYRPGFTPKEHREMLDRKELLEWQERREDKDKIWRSDERTRDNGWRAGELVVLIAGVIIAIFALRGGSGDTINNYSAATPITSSTPVTIRTP